MDDKINEQIENVGQLTQKGIDMVWEFGPDLVLALVTLILGLWFISTMTKMAKRSFMKRDLDPMLTPFLLSLFNMTLKVMLIISVIGMVGIEMTSFVAVLGAAGLAIGLSLQGTLQNFASGVMILVFKPFRTDDFVDVNGLLGTVKEIQIFNTILITPDNKRIIIPNGSIVNNSMTNFSVEGTRRIEWTIGIGYGDNYDTAKDALFGYIKEDDKILTEPEPFIALSSLGDSSVNIVVRAWVNTADYWDVFFQMNEKVYKGFGEKGLNIPFPQMDVHVHNTK